RPARGYPKENGGGAWPTPPSTVSRKPCGLRLRVVVERELVRMRTEPDGAHFVRHLVLDPGLDHVLGEDVALHEEVVILLQVLEGLLERARHLRNVLQFLGRERVDVLVEGIPGVEAPLDAVETGHHHGGERDVAVARRIREAYFDALRLG